MSEKSSSLPFSLPDHAHRQRRTAMKVYKRGAKATLALLTGICAFGLLDSHLDLGNSADTYILGPVDDALGRWLHLSSPSFPADESSNSLCPQVPAYTGKLIDFHSEPSIETLAARLGGAVRVDTSVEDDWPSVDEDPGRWEAIFGPFRKYLEETFPRVHGDERVSREVVNGHGLLFIWKGKEEGSKPLVLTAHQDVVPVNPTTVDEWVYPPFSGYFNSSTGLIWGRGASDDKASLISILSALEALLGFSKEEFVLKRTVVVSLGFDEESSGNEGALRLARRLEEIFGKDGVAMLVDEGGSVFSGEDPDGVGWPIATPAVMEKGYLDVRLSVQTPGGHSSVPPKHTSIGYLSQLISAIEAKPHEPVLRLDNAQLRFLQCTRDAPRTPPKLRQALRDLEWVQRGLNPKSCLLPREASTTSTSTEACTKPSRRERQRLDRAKARVLEQLNESERTGFTTTQAVDLISGGVKVNALPEETNAVINHRIEPGSSVTELREHLTELITLHATRLGLALHAFGKEVQMEMDEGKEKTQTLGKIVIEDAFGSALEPAPKTPLEGDGAEPWRLLSSVIRRTWQVPANGSGIADGAPASESQKEGILVAPDLMGGNTDTKSYWNLTRHIFRFSPDTLLPDTTGIAEGGIHTINEHAQVDGLVQGTRFYASLIQAVSEAEL